MFNHNNKFMLIPLNWLGNNGYTTVAVLDDLKSLSLLLIKMKTCLAGVAQWIERGLVNQRVAGLIPGQGTCLGCRPGPQLGTHEGQPHIDVSLPLFLLPFPFS